MPVIVRLARRPMRIGELRRISLGTIIEFNRPVDEPLELLVANRPIATGEAVKVGENFGLRVLRIEDRATRIRAMGPGG